MVFARYCIADEKSGGKARIVLFALKRLFDFVDKTLKYSLIWS